MQLQKNDYFLSTKQFLDIIIPSIMALGIHFSSTSSYRKALSYTAKHEISWHTSYEACLPGSPPQTSIARTIFSFPPTTDPRIIIGTTVLSLEPNA